MFFDMRYKKGGVRYDARYAEGVLIGLGHAMEGAQGLRDYPVEACTEAFKSQIRNDRVREDFRTKILPSLSDPLKRISDRLHLSSSLPFEETWRGGPDLVISYFSPTIIMPQGGKKIYISDTIANFGDEPSEPTLTRYYLSADRILDPKTDWMIGEREIGSLGPGETIENRMQTYTVPSDLPQGTYHVRICADATDTLVELNEFNNCPEYQGGLSFEAILK